MAIRDLLVTFVVLGSLPYIFFRPYIGIYMWAWLSYMNPHRLTWGFAYDLPFAQLVAATLLIGMVFSRDRAPFPVNKVSVIWLTLIGWMCFTTFFALHPEYAWNEWNRTMKIQLLALLTVVLIYRKVAIHGFIWIVTLSIVFFGVKGGVFILKGGGEGKVYGPMDSFFEDNNALAVTLLMVLPLLIYLIGTVKEQLRFGVFSVSGKLARIALWGFLGLSSVSVLFTWSRGALLTVVAMVGLALLKMKKRMLLFVAVVFGAIAVLTYLPDQWFERMQTIQTYQEDTSATGRINAWKFAINLTADRPIVGGGFDTYSPELFKKYAPNPDHFQDSHSIYFEMLGEHGYVGLFLFLLLGILTYRMAGRLAKTRYGTHPEYRDDVWVRNLGLALQFGLVAYAVGGAFLGLAYFDLYYHLVGIVLILDRYVVNRKALLKKESGDVDSAASGELGRR